MTTEMQWVLDASMGIHEGTGVFCPVEGDIYGDNWTVVTGLNYLGTKPPHGRFVGVVHEDGQEAVERFCEEHADFIAGITDDPGDTP